MIDMLTLVGLNIWQVAGKHNNRARFARFAGRTVCKLPVLRDFANARRKGNLQTVLHLALYF